MRAPCLSYNVTGITGSFWALRNSESYAVFVTLTWQNWWWKQLANQTPRQVPVNSVTRLPCNEQIAHKNSWQPTLWFSNSMNCTYMQVNQRGSLPQNPPQPAPLLVMPSDLLWQSTPPACDFYRLPEDVGSEFALQLVIDANNWRCKLHE